MYSICQVCGRRFSGLNCLKCTQAAITLQNFGAETIGRSEQAKTAAVISKNAPDGKSAKLKLPDGQLFAVPRPTCRIGQDLTNDIIISDDETTARFHAQISFDAGENEYVLRDLGTKEGTFLNGSQVHLDEAVYDGDMIKIGKYKFYFVSDL